MWHIVWALLVIFLIIFLASAGIFVNDSVAVRSLEKQGYSDIEIIEKDVWFVGLRGCGDSDAAKFYARATNPVGKSVDVFVCAGWLFKGATIRTD